MFLFKEIYISVCQFIAFVSTRRLLLHLSRFLVYLTANITNFFLYIFFLLIHLFLFFCEAYQKCRLRCAAAQSHISQFICPSVWPAIAMSICMSVCALERLQIPRLFVCLNNFYHRSRWAAWRYNSTRNKSGLNCRVHDTTRQQPGPQPAPVHPCPRLGQLSHCCCYYEFELCKM